MRSSRSRRWPRRRPLSRSARRAGRCCACRCSSARAPGIFGASLLGLGRAFGETIAVTMLIGNSVLGITTSIFGQGATMPSVIANEFTEATEPFHLESLFVVGHASPDHHADRERARQARRVPHQRDDRVAMATSIDPASGQPARGASAAPPPARPHHDLAADRADDRHRRAARVDSRLRGHAGPHRRSTWASSPTRPRAIRPTGRRVRQRHRRQPRDRRHRRRSSLCRSGSAAPST